MKHKYILSIIGIGVVTAVSWLSRCYSGAGPLTRGEKLLVAGNSDALFEQTAQESQVSETPPNAKVQSHREKPLYELVKTTSNFDPITDAKKQESLPFRMFGSGGIGKIVDNNGKIIAQSDANNGIFGCKISPDQKRIVIYRGDADFDLIEPSTGEKSRLPQQPEGDNVLGFSSWNWTSNETLVGISGKTIPFSDDQVGTDREEPIISRSIIYVYDLKTRTTSEVALPFGLRSKTVSISAVDDAGNVQLRPEGREESFTDQSLGWFELRRIKQ